MLTPSGKVLTTYQPSGGAGGLSAKYVLSGKTFKATVLGTDAAAGLALLQMQGADGRAFSTVTVGNSDTLVASTYASKQLSYHIPGEVFDTAVGTTGTKDAVIIDTGLLTALNQTVTVDGKTRTGLMQSRLQSVSASEIGGPLVNLTGQVIGITVAGGGDRPQDQQLRDAHQPGPRDRQADRRSGRWTLRRGIPPSAAPIRAAGLAGPPPASPAAACPGGYR